jgi:hypothetical protein
MSQSRTRAIHVRYAVAWTHFYDFRGTVQVVFQDALGEGKAIKIVVAGQQHTQHAPAVSSRYVRGFMTPDPREHDS